MDDRKKRAKEIKKKRERLNDRLEFTSKLERRDRFPMVVVESCCEAAEKLTIEINDAIKGLIDSDEIPPKLRRDLELMKTGELDLNVNRALDMGTEFGQILYENIQESNQPLDVLTCRFEVLIGLHNHGTITVRVHALNEIAPRLFCSPKQHQVEIDGKPRIVAYKYNTLEQIGNRVVHDPNDYTSRAMSLGIPFHTQYFELAELSNGQPCIKLWNTCDPLNFLGPVHGELLGSKTRFTFISGVSHFTIDDAICYYLLGYCPFHIDESGEYVVLDSLLIPGMGMTPEWAAFKKKYNPDTGELAQFSKQVTAHSYSGLVQYIDLEFICKLHEFVPQVRVIKEPVFDYPVIHDEFGRSIPWDELANLGVEERDELIMETFPDRCADG